MKLYISDLDGTLLNCNQEISRYTRDTIRGLVAKGLYFSVATARTALSAAKMLNGMDINMPVVLMNGAVIYDLQKQQYLNIEAIPETMVKTIIDIFKAHQITGFMYAVAGNKLKTYYENLNTQVLQDFYQERVIQYPQSFAKTPDFQREISAGSIIYFTFLDGKPALQEMADCFRTLPDIDMAFYEDIYHANLWYLEIFSKKASKGNAVKYFRNHYQFDTIIGFGDNYNDISFFEACDECYAASNAVEALKKRATGIIGDNCSDGVARFIAEHEGLYRMEKEA